LPHVSFQPALFDFLRELKAHNDREWFAANKQRYERDVRGPVLQFVDDFAAPLAKISRQVVADPRPVGGSMFRLHRDTRFSKDKSPYKTHVGIQFRHRQGRDVHAPCYYLHLEPGRVFAGAGIWHPDAAALAGLRTAVATKAAEWKKAMAGAAFKRECSLEGDSLKRPPRGFDPDHPLIEDLKRKDFIAATQWTEADVLAPGLPNRMAGFCRTTAPFTRFLARALKLQW
jgi:uncharacterized protein (TIGR02453 family)